MGRSSRLNRGPRDGRDACDAFIRKASRHVTASRSGTTVTDYTDSNSSRLSRVVQKPRKSVIFSGGTVTRIQNVTACHGRHEETRRRMYGSARDALIRVTAYGCPSRPKKPQKSAIPYSGRTRQDTNFHIKRIARAYPPIQRRCPTCPKPLARASPAPSCGPVVEGLTRCVTKPSCPRPRPGDATPITPQSAAMVLTRQQRR